MKIELKNLKHSEFASQETHCFETSVYVDGTRAFIAWNEGRGGPDNYDALPGKQSLLDSATAYCKTLPQSGCSWIDEETGEPALMDNCLEFVIGELIEEELNRRERQKYAGKGLAFHPDGDKNKIAYLRFQKGLNSAQKDELRKRWLPGVKKDDPDAIFFDGKGNYYE